MCQEYLKYLLNYKLLFIIPSSRRLSITESSLVVVIPPRAIRRSYMISPSSSSSSLFSIIRLDSLILIP